MKKIYVLVVVLAAACFVVSGCGKEKDGGGAAPKTLPRADAILDGEPKYFKYQEQCPVCGADRMSPKHYADVEGKRIYFDSQECVEKFKKNQSKYLQELDKRKKEKMGDYPGKQ